jgi:hypothetical protein
MASYNLVRCTTPTTGTGDISIGNVVTGYLPFTTIPDGTIVSYGIREGAFSEVGRGTYSSGVLTRDTVFASTNGNQKISLSGQAKVFVTILAEDLVPMASMYLLEQPGPTGQDGYTPIKGVDYFDGSQGIQGIKGDIGDTGPKGDTGNAGLKGDTGNQGIQGIQGIQGSPGDVSAAWPVGSIFISVVSTNPATLLGMGTWDAFATGRMLIGINGSDADFNSVEETGGAKTVSHSAHAGAGVADHAALTHSGTGVDAHGGTAVSAHSSHTHPGGTLAVASHTVVSTKQGTSSGNVVTTATHTVSGSTGNENASLTHSVTQPNAHTVTQPSNHAALTHTVTQPSGHSDHNIMNPYIVVYMWKRTA